MRTWTASNSSGSLHVLSGHHSLQRSAYSCGVEGQQQTDHRVINKKKKKKKSIPNYIFCNSIKGNNMQNITTVFPPLNSSAKGPPLTRPAWQHQQGVVEILRSMVTALLPLCGSTYKSFRQSSVYLSTSTPSVLDFSLSLCGTPEDHHGR